MSRLWTTDNTLMSIDRTLIGLTILCTTLADQDQISPNARELLEDTAERLARLLEVARDRASELEY